MPRLEELSSCAECAGGFHAPISPSVSSADIEEVRRQWPRIAIVQTCLGVAKALGLCSGAATLVLFLLLCLDKSPSLHISSTDFFEDVNAGTWRARVFSFDSDVLFDIWTPFIMGLVSVLVHFRAFRCLAITGNWIRFGLWNLAQGLFGNLGYCGIFGVSVGVVSLSAALLSFILFLFHAGPAHLWANGKIYLSSPQVPPWYSIGAGYWPHECMIARHFRSSGSGDARASTVSALPNCSYPRSAASALQTVIVLPSH